MEMVVKETRQAFRIFAKSPLLAIVIVLTLTLGIGANTTIFSLMNAVMLQNLPVNAPGELAVVGDPTQVHYRSSNTPPRVDVFSYKLYTDLRDNNNVFSSMLASGEVPSLRVARAGEARGTILADQAVGVLVSGNYFSLLGVNAELGRVLTPKDDDVPGAHPVAVVSYGFWKEKLGGDNNVIGSIVLLNNYPFTVIGVARRGFFGDTVGDQQDVWIPVTMQKQLLPTRDLLNNYKSSWFHIIGRLKPGVNLAQARANLNLVFHNLLNGPLGEITQFTDKESLRRLQVEVGEGGRGFSQLRGKYQQPLWLMMGIVGLVLLIACANVANLLLARALARHREVAVRLAIGAPPGRIVRQLLIESVLLAATGGALGLLISQWGVGLLLQFSQTVGTEVHLDLNVLLFTAFICILTGILFGLLPALRAVDVAIADALKPRSEGQGGGISANPAKWNWGKILVSAQVALSVIVLFTAGLFVRSMQNLRSIRLGFDHENLLLVRLDQISAGFTEPAQRAQLAEQLASRFSNLPSVRSVTYGQVGFFANDLAVDQIKIDGFVPKKSDDWNAPADRIGPNYFSILGVPLIRGRELTSQDTANAAHTTVINEAMEHFYFGHDDPIGKTLWITDGDKPDPYTIVGIVGNFRTHSLRNPVDKRFYVSMAQSPEAVGSLNFMIRTERNPQNLIDTVRKTIRDFNSSIPILVVRTLSDRIDESIRSEILVATLSGLFGLIALLLACIGLYGIMSYMVTGKTRSIGLRMALGAQRQDVLWMVLREAMILVILGVVIGIPVSLLCSNLLSSSLYELKTTDPIAMSLVVLVLAVVSLMASYVPARRATKVDPLIALRNE